MLENRIIASITKKYNLKDDLSIWERVDVYKEVKKYNNRIYKDIFGKEPPSFSLNLQPTYQGANLTLAYKFD